MIENIHKDIQPNLRKYNQELVDMKPQEMLTWGYEKFDNQFAITTSFGIQSSVLLNMVSKLFLQKKIKIFSNFGVASQFLISLLKTSYIKGLNIKLVSESTTRIGKEGLSFFKFKANVIPAKPAPTITIGFCIDFISEILLCVNVLLN